MNNQPPTSDKKSKIIVLALCYFFVFGLSNVSYFLPVYYKSSGVITPAESGLIVSIFYITSVFSRPFLAYVLSFLGFRRLFAVSGVMFTASSLAMLLFEFSFWPALLSRAVLGLSSSLYKIGFSTYQALAFDENERGRAYSLIMAGELLPLMTIAPLADLLIREGRMNLYIAIPVLMSIGAAAVVMCLPGTKGERVLEIERTRALNPFSGMGDCLRIPAFRLALLSMFFFSMADATASFMSSMTASFGLMASFFLSSNAFVGVSMRLFFSKPIDRLPKRVLGAACILLMSGALVMASINPSQASLSVLGVVFGMGMGLGFPLHLALTADSVPRARQAQASAMMWFTIGLNFSIVPLVMGRFETLLGAVPVFRIIASLALAGACVLLVLQIQESRQARGRESRETAPSQHTN